MVPGMRQLDVNFDFRYCLRVWEKCAQHTKKYDIELIVEGPGHEAFRCECWLLLLRKSMGEMWTTYAKYNIELIAEASGHVATRCELWLPVLPESRGEVCSTYEKYNIELIVEASRHEATRCDFWLPVLLKSMGEVCSKYEQIQYRSHCGGFRACGN